MILPSSLRNHNTRVQYTWGDPKIHGIVTKISVFARVICAPAYFAHPNF